MQIYSEHEYALKISTCVNTAHGINKLVACGNQSAFGSVAKDYFKDLKLL